MGLRSLNFEDLYIVTELMDTDLLQVIRSSQVISLSLSLSNPPLLCSKTHHNTLL